MKHKYQKSHGGRDKCVTVRFKKDSSGDCVIRALTHFFFGESPQGIDYTRVRDSLFAIAKALYRMPNDDVVVDTFLNYLWINKHSPLTHHGKKKYQIGSFPNKDESGCILIRCSKHLTCLYGDVILDTWDCRKSKAQSYWKWQGLNDAIEWWYHAPIEEIENRFNQYIDEVR